MEINCAHTDIVEIDSLIPNPKNPNKHSERQIKLLAKLLKHQGWRHPITVSNRSGFVVAGHGRIDAARLNGWDKVPIDRQDFENEAQEYAFLVSDNAIQELSELDKGMINSDIGELGPDFDVELLAMPDFTIGFDMQDLEPEEKSKDLGESKYAIEVQFPNEMEMRDIFDDLTFRGYLVKVK